MDLKVLYRAVEVEMQKPMKQKFVIFINSFAQSLIYYLSLVHFVVIESLLSNSYTIKLWYFISKNRIFHSFQTVDAYQRTSAHEIIW